MIQKIKIYKWIIVGISIFLLLLITLISWDAITETGDFNSFNIDFKNENNIVAAYGTLLGGMLAFLSILFVIFQIQEERQYNLEEKDSTRLAFQLDLLNRLKIIEILLRPILKEILKTGEVMKKFAKEEKDNPSKMNMMNFSSLNNFRRFTSLDELTTYKAFEFYKIDDDWRKDFININGQIDFYHENLVELRNKFQSQLDYKVRKQETINENLESFRMNCSELIDAYLREFEREEYLDQPWSSFINNFLIDYNQYFEEMDLKKLATNHRDISDNYLLPFLEQAMELRGTIGYDLFGSKDLIYLVVSIRRKIFGLEAYCRFYADNIEQYHKDYYAAESEYLKQLKAIKDKVSQMIQPS